MTLFVISTQDFKLFQKWRHSHVIDHSCHRNLPEIISLVVVDVIHKLLEVAAAIAKSDAIILVRLFQCLTPFLCFLQDRH